jgi:pyruvate/2-oxoglutarate dehydrogenase complex dihydrolipoamide dehydrogenase (E3) component
VGRIVIVGGGPAGYEAALVAAQLDAEVTVVEAAGAGGACVLSDCVPSKTFIASSEVATAYRDTEQFGVSGGWGSPSSGGLRGSVRTRCVTPTRWRCCRTAATMRT